MDMKLKMNLNLHLDANSLPPTKRNLLLYLPPLIILGLFGMLLIKPAFEERNALTEEIGKQRDEISNLERNSARLPKLKDENKRLESRLRELQMQLPEEKEVSELLKQVSELGIKSGLQIASWKPGARGVHTSKEVYEIPVEVTMRGVYHKFGQFYSNITMLNRIVNIFNINMKPGGYGLDVSFTAMTYSNIPEQERKALQEQQKKEKK